jgi:hypothetical protein
MSSSLFFLLIDSDDVRKLIADPTTVDTATMKRDARLLTVPRATAKAESNAAITHWRIQSQRTWQVGGVV